MRKGKILSAVMALSLLLGMEYAVAGSGFTVQAAENEVEAVVEQAGIFETPTVYTLNFGATALYANPDTGWDAGNGVKVSFGRFSGTNIDDRILWFRVLGSSPDTQTVPEGSILLDYASVLETKQFSSWDGNDNQAEGANDFRGSNLEDWLNGDGMYNGISFDTVTVFSDLEKSMIQKTTLQSREYNFALADGDTLYQDYQTEDYIFVLSAEEADKLYKNSEARQKVSLSSWQGTAYWLRSAKTDETRRQAGIIYDNGTISATPVTASDMGVSPALNIDSSRILFTFADDWSQKWKTITADSKNLSGTAYTGEKKWRLTIKDDRKKVGVQAGYPVTREGNIVTVPYWYEDNPEATRVEEIYQISVMITDAAYTEGNPNGAKIMYYGKMENIKDMDGNAAYAYSAQKGTGTFILPDAIADKKMGEDYHVYIIAESSTGGGLNDYASSPVEVTLGISSGENPAQKIESVVITDIDTPVAGTALDVSAVCATAGIGNPAAAVTWTANGADAAEAGYNTVYTASVVLHAAAGYEFGDGLTATVNGNVATVIKNVDGTVTVTYTFAATGSEGGEVTPTPEPETYTILDGADSNWTESTDGSIVIRGSGEISKFTGVKVDGNLIDADNYTVTEGSTVITLKAEYLRTLSEGSHTFEMLWTDGTATTGFSVSRVSSGGEGGNDDGNEEIGNNENEGGNNGGNSGTDSQGASQIVVVPKTGDNSDVVLWTILTVVSLAGLVVVYFMIRREGRK